MGEWVHCEGRWNAESTEDVDVIKDTSILEP